MLIEYIQAFAASIFKENTMLSGLFGIIKLSLLLELSDLVYKNKITQLLYIDKLYNIQYIN